jgi:leucyl-tRNA synthetase
MGPMLSPLRNVHGPAGDGEALEHQRRGRRLPFSWPGLAFVRDEASETEFEQGITVDPSRGPALLNAIGLNPAIRDVEATPAQMKALHACIKKVTEDLEGMRFNTGISAMMMFVNEATAWEVRPRTVLRTFLVLLQPFAPHVAEELWHKLEAATAAGSAPKAVSSLAYEPWPKHDPQWLIEDTIEFGVQVNGKVRDRVTLATGATDEDVKAAALASPKVQPFLEGKTIKKIIVVPRKLVNIAVA